MNRKEWLEFAVLAIRSAETTIAIEREWSARLLIVAAEAVQHAMTLPRELSNRSQP